MIDGIYNVTVKSPIGVNRGSLKLETEGETVKASLSLIGMGNLHSTGKVDGDTFTMQGNMRMFTFGHFA